MYNLSSPVDSEAPGGPIRVGSGAHDRSWRMRAGGKEREEGEDGAPI